ncbi:PHB depolymerase family esterase [Streptomyces sp. FIT100]|uniref:alpha/beta hydrolase family esterase n=1 Tax=Streptomyces sp. FIT100 TaxID=2837956 RepID=UPI0021CAE058|nr:PHB depolymerase family esterase [Streptomyces sp. FIT100]UUN28190.1 dienelactone hydrolase family protein [Streptomyces sp. FIT100]
MNLLFARFRPRTTARGPLLGALALGLALTAGCAPPDEPRSLPTPAGSSPNAGHTAAAADTRERLRVDGGTREYLLHRPGADGGAPRPLVIAYHGRGSSAEGMREMTGLGTAAAARDMLIAYPEGLHSGWGAGAAATGRRPDPDADVRFTEALVEELVRTEGADPLRVYVVGFSNGGSMALRMAAQRPGLLAGAAAVAGQLPTGPAAVEPTGAVPVLMIHGAEDPVRPLAGLPSPGPAAAGEEPITPSMASRAGAEAFAAEGGARAPVERSEAGYDRTVWGPGDSRATVELLVVHGAGHTWPGSSVTPPAGFGRTSTSLDATGTILGFFAARRR